MRYRIARITIVLALTAGITPGWLPVANAEAPTEYGYWYRLNSRQAILPTVPGFPPPPTPAPPGVPEGGVYLGQDPTEPLAVAAFLFLADDGPGAVFSLDIARGAVPPEGADLMACPATASFATEFAGFWENRPQGDCETIEVPGETLGANESFLWTLTAEFQVFPGYWSFVVVPTGTVPFEIVFDAPGPASFSVDPGPGAFDDDFGPPPGDFGGPVDDFTFEPGTSPPMFTDFGGDFSLPDVEGVTDAPTADLPEQPIERAVAPPVRNDTTARILAIMLLASMGAGMYFLSRQRARPAFALPGGLKSPDDVEIIEDSDAPDAGLIPVGPVGGIGRFQRARTGGPRRLV